MRKWSSGNYFEMLGVKSRACGPLPLTPARHDAGERTRSSSCPTNLEEPVLRHLRDGRDVQCVSMGTPFDVIGVGGTRFPRMQLGFFPSF